MVTATTDSFPLSTEDPYANTDAGGSQAPGVGTDAGSTGDSSAGTVNLSTGGLIAIVVVVVGVTILGAVTAGLFFVAKKREWTVKETIRRSAHKVAKALTPRRSEFPDSVKGPRSSRKARVRIADDVPPTPRITSDDIEKGHAIELSKHKVKK